MPDYEQIGTTETVTSPMGKHFIGLVHDMSRTNFHELAAVENMVERVASASTSTVATWCAVAIEDPALMQRVLEDLGFWPAPEGLTESARQSFAPFMGDREEGAAE